MKIKKRITNKLIATIIIIITMSSLSLNNVIAKSSNIKVTKVKINNVSTLYLGKKKTLKATITPGNASNKKLTWKSSNSKIIKVVDSNKGIIQAVKVGKAKITATAKDGSVKKASITINVKCNHEEKTKEITQKYNSNGHYVQYRCKLCNKVVSTLKNTEEHSMSSWKTTKEATEEEPGEQTRTCKCGYSETRKLKPISKYEKITEELNGIDVLYVTDVIDNKDSYTLRGVIYTQYLLSNSEFEQIIENGSMTLEGSKYIIEKVTSSDDYYENYQFYLFPEGENYPVFKVNRASGKGYYIETILYEVPDVWKLTDRYKEITITKDLKCKMESERDEGYKLVTDVFKNYKSSTPENTIRPDKDKTFTFKFENGKCVELISEFTSC